MAKESGLIEFYHRFQALQAQRETSDTLIRDLIVHAEKTEKALRADNERLTKETADATLDLADSTTSRRELQKHVDYFKAELLRVTRDYDSLKFRNPYITILIDGDGLIFQDRYIQRGVEGGKEAAYELRRLIVLQCGDEVEVQCKIVANLNGLAKAMVRDNVIWKVDDLRDFFWGFTQANPSFDFVDVGHGKERADSKIKENTRWHLQNSNCKQILLGISHDSGYAPFLDEILRDDLTRRQVTILEGVPTVKDLVNTGVNVFQEIRDLFRCDKLLARTPMERQERIPSFERATSLEFSAPSSMTGSPQATSSTTIPTPPMGTNTNSPITSWADVTQKVKPASPPPIVTLPFATISRTSTKDSGTLKTKAAALSSLLEKWNPGDRGLDEAVVPKQAVLDQIKKRKDNQKICNNHFLRGPCTKQGCQFVHDYSPTDDELTVIAYLARLNPCTRAQDCDNYDCIYGHHCQSMKGDMCLHPFCKYPEEAHPPGTKYKNSHIDKNN